MKFTEIFSTANSKLKKDNIAVFSLPAGETCPMAGECLKYCYAKKGAFLWSPAKNKRAKNLAFTKQKDFVSIINKSIKEYKGKYNTIRIHDSGDFYNKRYFLKWIEIALDNPSKQFYAYTKSFSFLDLSLCPDNFKVIQSEGSKKDEAISNKLPLARIFKDIKELKKAGFHDCSKSDIQVFKAKNKIGLILH